MSDSDPDYSVSDQVGLVAELLERLPKTVPSRRAALLAAARVQYDSGKPITDYAPALFRMNNEELRHLSITAGEYAFRYPNRPEDPFPEDERIRYLAYVAVVAQDVEADEDLSPADRRHMKSLVQELGRALEAAPQTGSRPVETAAKAIVGDAVINKRLWQRVELKPWAKRLAGIATALIMVVSGYSSGKELVADASAWFGQLPAITTEQPRAPEADDEIHEAEILPGDSQEEPE